ncbi:hypothetical protein COLO4_30566 [Corchorus olitorius]|uniref:Uncharacterized protein n=1 Tax=Corchorus olitorius TaxID=93759 RepID=A0A1R3H7Y7_9ROSI|nr:hypothetical protein COLO4_30566 [Corchorus olitorius]
MALYEQLSIPCQRFNSGSSFSMLPAPPNNSSNLVPSIFSSRGGGNERSMFMPLGNSSESTILGEKFHSYSISGIELNIAKGNQERKLMKVTDHQSLDTTSLIPAISKSKPLQPLSFSSFKAYSLRKPGHDDDLRVPTSARSGIDQNRSCSKQQSHDQENLTKLDLSSSTQLQTANEKQVKENNSVDPKSRRYVGIQAEEDGRLSRGNQDLIERSNSFQSNRDSSSGMSTKIKNSESLKRPHASLNQENKSSLAVMLNSIDGPNARLHQECTQNKLILRENILVEPGRCRENASKVRNEPYLRQPLAVDNGSPIAIENRNKAQEEKKSMAIEVGGVGRHNNVPSALVVESISPLDISPDDVVGIMGEKQFWKVRRAIVKLVLSSFIDIDCDSDRGRRGFVATILNDHLTRKRLTDCDQPRTSCQQRVFAVQVFELHRLLKVQKLIAGSPQMLLEETIFMGKPSLDISIKKFPSDRALEIEPSSILKVKDNSQKPNISIECADENAVAKLPLPSSNDETSRGLVTQRTKHGPYSGNALSTPIAANTRTSPWCFSPPGSQWLVPVMSPSEGLVYKPYTGPCPPSGSFMAPVYGSCGPVNLAAGGGEFLNTAYGVPASHQQGIGIHPGIPPIGQTYFPHYGMPVMNPSVSGSAVEQMSPFTGVPSKGNQLSTGDVNFTIAHQSSCNMPSQMSQANSYCAGKFPASKESERQGSTASSPSERPKVNALPLFPTEPTTQASDHNAQTSGQRTRVIKVVPRNPRLATESAARIFQSIQEERKQYE